MNRRPSRYVAGPSISAAEPAPGFYKRKLRKGTWQPARITVEHSRDDDGRVADRPRLVLHIGSDRYEQGYGRNEIIRFWPLHPIDEREYRRLNEALTETGGETDLDAMPARF